MSTYFLRGRRWFVKVPTNSGRWIQRATGTTERTIARAMARMIDELGPSGKRDWDLLNAVASGELDIPVLYDAYHTNDLNGLREQLRDIDLEPFVQSWLDVLESRVAADTVAHYKLYVRSLIVSNQRFPRSALSYPRLSSWLASHEVGPSTRRKYHAAMSGFCEYLRAAGVLAQNPMRDVNAPSAAAPRMRYLDSIDEMRHLADAQPEPYRTLSLLMHATGIEISVALALKRRDVDPLNRAIHARGTKTKARDRHVIVADWAWPDLKGYIRALLPNALLFPEINRWTASDKHRDACKRLKIEDYWLRDSRHTYAVRAIRAGAPFEHVAKQLGHADTMMVVKVYGRFKLSEADRTDWERIAALQDKARRAAQ